MDEWMRVWDASPWSEEAQEEGDEVQVVPAVLPRGGVQQPGLGVEEGEAVPGARHDLKELRRRVHEVDDLRREEEESINFKILSKFFYN